VVIVDFFRCLDERQQASWKQCMWLVQASPCDGVWIEQPEVETHLKLLYTAVTRLQRRQNFVKLATDTRELKPATGMMSPDEWIHRGLEFAWKAWESRSEDRAGEEQEERAKSLWKSSDGWTRRENASARQFPPVSASFLNLRRILFLNKLSLLFSIY